MSNLNLPILIYVGKDKCPACIHFDSEWQKIINKLNGKARLIKFICYPQGQNLPPPPPLRPYVEAFPTLLLAGPNSYFRCFTPDDQVNRGQYSDNYSIRAIKMDTNMPRTVENIVNWFEQISPQLSRVDEPTPPRSYYNR